VWQALQLNPVIFWYMTGETPENLEVVVAKIYGEVTLPRHWPRTPRTDRRHRCILDVRNRVLLVFIWLCQYLKLHVLAYIFCNSIQMSPYNKDVCFFCDGPPVYRKNLHNISTFSAGEFLCTAIGMSANDKLSVKLNTSIAADDAHLIDIKYHKNCWTIHVSHVLRRGTSELSSEKLAGEIAAQIEFLTMTEMTLRSGKVATMS